MSRLKLVHRIDMTAASRIKLLRQRSQFTQRRLSDFIGVSPSTISAWECGRSTPSKLARIRLYEYERGLIKQPVTIRWVW